MRYRRFGLLALGAVGMLAGAYSWARQDVPSVPSHRFFHVQLGANETQPVSGRLLLFAIDAKTAKTLAKDGSVKEVDIDELNPAQTAIAGQEVYRIAPGQVIDIDADKTAFPQRGRRCRRVTTSCRPCWMCITTTTM